MVRQRESLNILQVRPEELGRGANSCGIECRNCVRLSGPPFVAFGCQTMNRESACPL